MSGLEELRRLEGAATEGPWVARQDFIDGGVPDNSMTINGSDGRGDYIASVALSYKTQGNDAEFIVAARNELPRILDALDAVLALAESAPRFATHEGGNASGIVQADDVIAAITNALEGDQ